MNTSDHKNQKNIIEINGKKESNVDAAYYKQCGLDFYHGSKNE